MADLSNILGARAASALVPQSLPQSFLRQRLAQITRSSSPVNAGAPLPAVPVTVVDGNESMVEQALSGLYSMITGNANDEIPRIENYHILDALTKNFQDTKTVAGDCVSASDDLTILNQSARSFMFEPQLMEKQMADHVPYDVNSAPITFSFDKNGDGVLAGDPYSSVLIQAKGDATLPLTVGWLYLIQGNDALVNATNFNVTTKAGFIVDCMLKDVQSTGVLVVLNSVPDNSFSMAPGAGVVTAGQLGVTAVGSGSTVPNQFYQSFLSTQMDSVIKGRNVVVYAYPIFNQRSINALINALIYDDRLPDLAHYVRAATSAIVHG